MSSKQQDNINVKPSSSSFHSRAKLDVTCYCCQEKGHYASDCTKSLNNSNNIHIFSVTLSKEREHPVKISMLMQQRAKVKIKPSIVTEGTIVMKADQVSDTLLLDTDAESNVISQCFTVTNEMVK